MTIPGRPEVRQLRTSLTRTVPRSLGPQNYQLFSSIRLSLWPSPPPYRLIWAQSKTGRALRIPLTADVGNALSAYLLDERPSADTPYVFLRSRAPFTVLSGHSACYAVLRRAFLQAGIRVGSERKGLHLLRHSAASRMLSRGVPVTTISSLLGHAHKASTERYLVTDLQRMRECALDLSLIPVNCAGLSS